MSSGGEPTDVWLALTGRFSARLFVDTGILAHLRAALGDRVVPVLLCDDATVGHWSHLLGPRVIRRQQLGLSRLGRTPGALGHVDEWLERAIGYYSLSLRFNRRHGLLRERMRAGHPMPYLNTALLGPLPEWHIIERLAYRFTFSSQRPLPLPLTRRFRGECAALVLATVSGRAVQPVMAAARRWRRPSVGYVASWDHTVGKGVVSSHVDRYLVQNEIMARDLVAYHRIDPARITVTGWPQTDVFSKQRPRAEYNALLEHYGLDSARPTVLYAGNTPENHPTEGAVVARLASWLESTPSRTVNLIVRPHPNDAAYLQRFGALRRRPAIHVQTPTYEDLEVLTAMLQHVDCVAANAGTILLDAVVNDRPAVCVLYDEDGRSEPAAAKNVTGHHYRVLAASGAFYPARDAAEAKNMIARALDRPGELAEQRAVARRELVGEIDGRAAERVVNAILDGIGMGA